MAITNLSSRLTALDPATDNVWGSPLLAWGDEVTAGVNSGGTTPTDASTTGKGVVQLAGDLTGTAAAPTLRAITTAGSYGSSSRYTSFTVDSKGRVTAAADYPLPSATPTTNTQSGAAYTLAISDAGNRIENTGSGVLTVTVPSNSTVAFGIETVVEFRNYGTGSIVLAAPTIAPAASETFTGTTGAAWPSGWTGSQLNAGTAGTATIQSNAGALYAGTAGSYREYWSGMTAQADTDLTFSVTFTSQISSNFWTCISADNLVFGGNGNIPQNAYIFYLGIDPTSTASQFGLYSTVSNTGPYTLATGTITITAAVKYKVRFQRTGTTIQFKLWAASGSEPSTWTASAVDAVSQPPAGRVSFTVDNTQTATIDDAVVSGAGAGLVTLRSPSGFRLATQYASAAIVKRATDEWIVSGLTVN